MQPILNNASLLSPVLERYTEEELNQRFAPIIQVIDRGSYPLFAIIGIPGSLISAIIWSRKSMRRGNSAAAIYQASSGVVDLCYLLLFMIWYLHSAWSLGALDFPVLCESFIIMNYWFQYLFPGLLLVFTLERYLAICHPFRTQHCLIRASEKGAVKILMIILTICLSTASPNAYFYTYLNETCSLRAEVNSTLINVYDRYTQVTELFFFFCLPLATLFLNVMVIRVLHRSVDIRKNPQLTMISPVITCDNEAHGRHEQTTFKAQTTQHISRTVRASTVTILCTSFYVLLVYLGYSIIILIFPTFRGGDPLLTDDEVAEDPNWQAYFHVNIAKSVMTGLQNSQCAAKFPIYLVTSRQYRKEFCRLFCHCAPECCTRAVLKSSIFNYHNNIEDSACHSFVIRAQPQFGQGHRKTWDGGSSWNSAAECPPTCRSTNHALSLPRRPVLSRGTLANKRGRPSLGLTRSVIMANGDRAFLTSISDESTAS